MYRLIFLLLFVPYALLHAELPETLEKTRHLLTHYFHTIVYHINKTAGCEANCTHPEIMRVKKNSLHLITSIKSTEDHRFSFSLNMRGNIYLPKLSKKIRITFAKQSADKLTNKQIDRENENLITDTKLRIGLQYLFTATEKLEISTRLGIRLHNPFDLYQELSVRKKIPLYKDYTMYTTVRLHYYLTQLYLSKSLQLTFIKPLSDRFLLAQSNDWYSNSENKHERHIVNHLKLHQRLNRHDHLVYWISYASLAQRDHHYKQDWQALSLSYIHFFNKWFYLQAIPRIVQKHHNHYRNEYEATLSFGMILGK